MPNKPRSPSQIAKERPEKKNYAFSLIKKNVESIQEMAATSGVPVSEIVDEAIAFYLHSLKENGKNN